MNTFSRLLFPFSCVAACIIAHAAETPPGHSMNGDAFDEGPRQAAVLMPGTGDVHFPITTKNELAQKFFDQGVGQLHGFWYFEAERSFRQAAALDPECAITYWGMAMANTNNPQRAAKFIKEATKRKDQASRREQLWIASLADYYADSKKDEKVRREAVVSALEDLTFEFPDDLEAKAFLVLEIWENKSHGIPFSSRRALDSLAQEVLAKNPMHPGINHYRIHLWNGANGDKRALDSAAKCGQSAPSIAHMWHMSGHTFSNLKRYADAAWQQEASARVDHAYTIARHVLPDQIHNFAHNNDWLVKDLQYIGRVHDAVDLAKNMIELPRLGSKSGKSFKMGRERLLETLLRFELWDELAALDGTMYLAPENGGDTEPTRVAALGVAYFRKGDLAKGNAKLAELEGILKKRRDARIAAGDAAEAKAESEKKSEDEIAKAAGTALRQSRFVIKEVETALAEVRVYQALAEGKLDAAKTALTKATGISSERRARISLELGDKAEAEKFAREAVKADEAQTPALATLAGVLWQGGKKDEALSTFKKLCDLSAQLDLAVPLFSRLAPLAQELKLPADWRVPLQFSSDSGTRPALAALGPFRWHPSPAPEWSLPDRDAKPVALADLKGQAVLVVFYLGGGCASCMEQLNVFAPMAQQFKDAGISIVAISTEAPGDLTKTFAKSKQDGRFPFPILADPEFGAFK
ncbi:MAG: redoxin domain-containing protein, partial [Chthoniobacteraceae bacterium]